MKKTIVAVIVAVVATVTAFASPRANLGAKPSEMKYQDFQWSQTESDTVYIGDNMGDVETWRFFGNGTVAELFKQLDNNRDLGAYPEEKKTFGQLKKFFKSNHPGAEEMTMTEAIDFIQSAMREQDESYSIYMVNIQTNRYSITINIVEFEDGKYQGYRYTYESKSAVLSSIINALDNAATEYNW